MIVTGIIILGIAVYSICVVPGVPEKTIAVNHSGALA